MPIPASPEQEQVAVAAADLGEPPLGEGHVLVARHDHRRQQRPDVRHARSLGHPGRASIGRMTDALSGALNAGVANRAPRRQRS